ncbi:MAG: hypothetical protein KGL15_03130, partial [Acidobacteriota bacterium]|nr:hypothetical protein [Acidobacteriota bacterium]
MTAVDPATELRFEPPGPGPWELEDVHFPRPVTRYWSEMHPAALGRGFREFTAYYGMLLDGLEYAYVNGFAYHAPRPVAPEQAPERFQRAEEVFANKLWREQLREWDETFKPASIRRHKELQAVAIEQLSDAELADYLRQCYEHHQEMIYQHMRHTGAAMVAIGDLLAHAGAWTDVPHAELLGMMRGTAPVSAGASGELAAMVSAINADPAAREIMNSDGDAGETLARLRSLDSDAGRAVSAYLELTGYRLLDGFDISGRYALEMPDALLRAIRAQVAGAGDSDAAAEAEAKIAEVREKVPAEHRDEFDEMVGEARLMYRIRDERGVYSDIWASGIMRRAAIGAGRRLAAKGRIHDPEHFVDASFEEMQALVLGTDGPSADELAARHQWRTTHTAKDAPRHLGPPPPPPPDPAGLP